MKIALLYPSMPKLLIIFFALLIGRTMIAQEVTLPPDLRQYNLTQFNSSLLNPSFTLDRNNPQSLSLWTRWQWQQIDADPTTVFVNYTHRLQGNAAFGVGFLQQNTGVFLQTGGVLNYAYKLNIDPDFHIALGINVYGFQQELADDRFQQGPGLPFIDNGPSFVIQAAPGIQLGYKNLRLGFVGENVVDYNITEGEKNNGFDDKIYVGHASYEFPIPGAGIFEGAYLRPMAYLKTVPTLDTQYGLNTLFGTQKFWAQAGYNNFYGVSGGVGGTFFNKFSIGALVEIGTSSDLDGKEPTFEIVTSYQFAVPVTQDEIPELEEEQEETPEPVEKEEEAAEEETEIVKEKKLSRKERKALALAQAKRTQDSLLLVKRTEDSLALAKSKATEIENELRLKEIQRKKDSVEAIAKAKLIAEEEKPKKGERFEEAVLTEDIRPGYYLIVNVFGTKTYYNRFMQSLKDKGIDPKSFYRTQKKYNYVYLERYDSMQEARKARDSKFFGKYPETIWIFRVKAK
ncbi:MAG: PorP/SprF family type IX secretion system membrane protein [Eudoraea sp.]|nr:PorP/SprF family type IX secretion system membrane protein [Eudoraea sp.]